MGGINESKDYSYEAIRKRAEAKKLAEGHTLAPEGARSKLSGRGDSWRYRRKSYYLEKKQSSLPVGLQEVEVNKLKIKKGKIRRKNAS